MDLVGFWDVQIDHAGTTTLSDSSARKCHAGFSKSTASAKDRPLQRVIRKVDLKCSVVFIGKTDDLFCEVVGFN
jgi:BRCT domain type II-containing protein